MEERNGVLNVFEVGGNLQPAAEVPPLEPGGGIFIEEGCIETLGDRLLCIIVVRFHLHADGRGCRRHAFYVGSVCGSGK